MPATTPTVFLSYRRDDSNWATDLLFDRLEAVLGEGSLFRDVDGIKPGEDFRARINQSLGRSSVVLAIIGPQWLNATDTEGRPRLEQTEDWVRIEIEAALEREITIIPVLLYPAKQPPASELPPSMEKLSYLQGVTISSGQDFNLGFKQLVEAIIPHLPQERQAEARKRLAEMFVRTRPFVTMSPWRWVVLLIGAVLAISVALSVRFMGRAQHGASSVTARDAAAQQFAGEVQDWFNVRFRKMESVAERTSLKSNVGSRHDPELMAVAKSSDFTGGVYTLNASGIILSQATPNYPNMDNLRGMNFSHREYFTECQRRNRSVTTNAFNSANRNEVIVVLASPRRSADGAFIGIVDAVVDVGTSPLSSIAQRIAATRQLDLYLVDSKGMVLASNQTEEIAKPFRNGLLLARFRNHSSTTQDQWAAKFVPVPETPYAVIGIRITLVE
jgi:hypothetical protein